MKKIMTVFSTKAEAIKICPLLDVLTTKKDFEVKICLSDQYRELVEPVLEVFKIEPDYILSMTNNTLSFYDLTIIILQKLKTILENEEPDLVLVQGDSSTSFVTALACFYLHIPIGHIEAGLRTYTIQSSFPEEFNRQAMGIIASYNFVPTRRAKLNLINEGKDPATIFITGNTAIDALKRTIQLDYTHPYLAWAEDSRLIIVTVSRRETAGETLKNICRAVKRIVDEVPGTKVIFPVEPTHAGRKTINELIGKHENIRLIDPLPVEDFHNFLNKAYLILTDSGGIQEEAPSLGKPVLVIRDITERPEGIRAGTLKLVGTNEEDIVRNCKWLLSETALYQKMSKASNPYGDGYASDRIADIIQTGRRWEWNENSISHLDFKKN